MTTKEIVTSVIEDSLMYTTIMILFEHYYYESSVFDSFCFGLIRGVTFGSVIGGCYVLDHLLEPKNKYIDERTEEDN